MDEEISSHLYVSILGDLHHSRNLACARQHIYIMYVVPLTLNFLPFSQFDESQSLLSFSAACGDVDTSKRSFVRLCRHPW